MFFFPSLHLFKLNNFTYITQKKKENKEKNLRWIARGNETPKEMHKQEMIFLRGQISYDGSLELFCSVKHLERA